MDLFTCYKRLRGKEDEGSKGSIEMKEGSKETWNGLLVGMIMEEKTA